MQMQMQMGPARFATRHSPLATRLIGVTSASNVPLTARRGGCRVSSRSAAPPFPFALVVPIVVVNYNYILYERVTVSLILIRILIMRDGHWLWRVERAAS